MGCLAFFNNPISYLVYSLLSSLLEPQPISMYVIKFIYKGGLSDLEFDCFLF